MIRGILLVSVALFIDGLQAGIAMALAGIPVLASSLPLVGWLAGAIAAPLGIVLGIVVSICLTAIGGSLLATLLVMCGMPYWKYIGAGFLGEVTPGINLLPTWTTVVILCLLRKMGEENTGTILGKAAEIATAMAPQGGGAEMIGTAATAASIIRSTENTPTPARAPMEGGDSISNENPVRSPIVSSPRIDGINARPKIASTAIVLLLLFGFGNVTHAQSVPGQVDPVQYIVTPEVPGPNQTVGIEVQGIGSFLGDATVTWQLGGKTMQSGIGLRTFSFTTGPLGTQSQVHVIISSASKGTLVRDFTFLPSLVNLVWEADTSVPPLYRGKALYSAGSHVTVTAFPQIIAGGVSASANTLSYQWKHNGTPVPEQSGRGRNTFSFDGDQLQNGENVSVDVYVDDTAVAQSSIFIPATDPVLVLYDRDPLRGVLYDTALPSAISLSAKEITVQAQPYFFSNSSLVSGGLTYTWTLNDQTVTGPDTGRGIMTLRQTGSGAGQGRIGVGLQDTSSNSFVQAAKTALQIVFGVQNDSGSASLFGL